MKVKFEKGEQVRINEGPSPTSTAPWTTSTKTARR